MIDEHFQEVIFIGLPGPTHHYGGLSADNVASSRNRGSGSRPKLAALQALSLARLLRSLGVMAAILPPQLRPYLPLLRQHFTGSDEDVIRQAALGNQALLEQASSSSAMWVANAATVAPSIDCADGLLHLSVANLHANPHRRIEAEDTYRVLQAVFKDVPQTRVHAPLPAALGFRDEGAANHMRLGPRHSARGLHVFVYGEGGSARQSLAASREVARQQSIGQTLFLRQHPDAIRHGVFHNDVIAVGNESVLLAHEQAYAGGMADIRDIARAYKALHGQWPTVIAIAEHRLRIDEAVQSYFFNSQIVTRPGGGMTVIAPLEVKLLFGGKGAALLEAIRADRGNPIDQVQYIDLRQSMRNGGGPACLRLRVPVSEAQLAALKTTVNVMAEEALQEALEGLIIRHYPETLTARELGNPALYHQCRTLLAEMAEVMRIPLLS